VLSIKVLSFEMNVERRLLTKQWKMAFGDRAGMLRDFLGWLILLYAAGHKAPGRGWAHVSSQIGVDEETLGRFALRAVGVPLRNVTAEGQRGLLQRFQSYCEQLLGVWPGPPAVLPPLPLPERCRVLLIDDLEAVRVALGRVLGRAGFDVRTAASGRLALSQMERDPSWTQVLLTDVRMPDINGVDLARTVIATWPLVRIALISAVVSSEATEVVALRDTHPSIYFLEKPLGAERVIAMVREICEKG
jgi:CheY-like chemotaxis protein